MLSNIINPNKINTTRLKFLQIITEELGIFMSINKSKVNSRTIQQAHTQYVDDIYYVMKEKKLFEDEEFENIFKITKKEPRRLSDTLQKLKATLSRKNSLIAQPATIDMRLNKKGVSDQKFEHFRRNTLSKFYRSDSTEQENILIAGLFTIQKHIDDMVEYINIESGFIYNEKTLQRTEKGFTFLKALVNRIKLKKDEHTFDELKKILCLKENIDDDISEGRLSNRSKRSCNYLTNNSN
jgi:hypothetical protein